MKRQEELSQYQLLLTEIEIWLERTRETIQSIARPDSETQVAASIENLNQLGRELDDKEKKLEQLAAICEEFKKYPDLKQLAETLVEQLTTLTLIFAEQRTTIKTKIDTLRKYLEELKEDKSENTLDSGSMPIEESPVVGVHIETQTGRSLASPEQVVTRDFTVTYNEPVDVQIQTQLSESSDVEPGKHKETITISKTVADGAETIQIATKPMAESQPIVEEPDDLLVEANYRKQTQTEGKSTELNITNAKPNQPFETVFVEPDETTTEVIVDADGTKRIIVKKLHRTVVRHQQTVQQQQLTSTSTITDDAQAQPVSQSFSQVTLKEQQSSTTLARGDGSRQTVTSKQYGGKIVSGVPGGDVDVQEFQTDPETQVTVVEGTRPSEIEIEGIRLHEGDVTFLDQENKLVPPYDGSEIHTSSSSVRAVVQQVTRRIIKKTRRIIRRTVIVDGKEQVTEEIVEEPEEIEVTEEGIPRVSINVTRTEDGRVVQEQQFGEPTVIVEEPGTSVTQTVTGAIFDGKPIEALTEVTEEGERYVVEHPSALPPQSSVTSASKDFIENERFALSSTVEAPRVGDAPEKAQTPRDELPGTGSTDVVVETVTSVITSKAIPTEVTPQLVEEISALPTPPVDKPEVAESVIQVPSPEIPIVEAIKETVLDKPVEVQQTIIQTVTTPVVSVREVKKVTEEPETGQPLTTIEIIEKTVTKPEDVKEETVKQELREPKTEEVLQKPMQLNGDVKRKDINIITQEFITSQQYHEPQGEIKQTITIKTEIEEPVSPKDQEKIKESPKKEDSDVPKTQTPGVEEPLKPQNVEIELSLQEKTPTHAAEFVPQPVEKPKETPQEVEIALSLEEKQPDVTLVSPQVSMTMTFEEKTSKTTPAELIQKDIHVTLPAVTHSATATVKSVALSPMFPQVEHQQSVATAPITPKLESEHIESPTPSDIDHGGRGSKKKKKHKEESPSEEIEEEKEVSIATSVAESTEIIVPDDSLPSEETPKPTEEVFEPVTESEEEEEEVKDTGYEADKTTVDESLADDDTQKQKTRRKKKKKQKVKVKETEESNIPKSAYESSPFGESVALTDDEPVKVAEVKVEEPKKAKKKRKGKRGETRPEEVDSEQALPETQTEEEVQEIVEMEVPIEEPAEIKKEEPTIQEARDVEIVSPNDSYHTLSTQSDLGTVKIVEEGVLRPLSESPQEITEKIVTTVPILETVITQESLSQTSPELNQVVQQFIEHEQVATEPVSVQTSPEVPKEVEVTSVQTSPEPVPEVIKPEIQDSSSQVEIETTEIVTQTEIPEQVEKVEVVTSEASMQTATPEKVAVVEEEAQTSSPETVEIPRSESAMQTTIVESQEEFVQTQSPDIQFTESAVQAQPTPADHSMQTSPEPSAPPFEEVFAEEIASAQEVEVTPPAQEEPSLEEVPPIQEEVSTAEVPPVEEVVQQQPSPQEVPLVQEVPVVPAKEIPETSETVTQTSPVMIHDINELTPPSSLSEQYEVHVEASVTVPSESTESEQTLGPVQPKPVTETESEESSRSDVDVEVSVDGEPVRKPRRRRRHRKAKKDSKESVPSIEKDFLSAFQRKDDGGLLDPKELYSEVAKRHSRSSSPVRPEESDEAIVVGKVITDLDEDKVKKLASKSKSTDDGTLNVTVEVVPTETPSTSPDDFEVVTEDVVTKRPGEKDFEITSTVKVVTPEESREFVTREQVSTVRVEAPKFGVADFLANERAAAEVTRREKDEPDKKEVLVQESTITTQESGSKQEPHLDKDEQVENVIEIRVTAEIQPTSTETVDLETKESKHDVETKPQVAEKVKKEPKQPVEDVKKTQQEEQKPVVEVSVSEVDLETKELKHEVEMKPEVVEKVKVEEPEQPLVSTKKTQHEDEKPVIEVSVSKVEEVSPAEQGKVETLKPLGKSEQDQIEEKIPQLPEKSEDLKHSDQIKKEDLKPTDKSTPEETKQVTTVEIKEEKPETAQQPTIEEPTPEFPQDIKMPEHKVAAITTAPEFLEKMKTDELHQFATQTTTPGIPKQVSPETKERLSPETKERKPKSPSPKTKRKPKHVSSVTIEEVESPIRAPELPISPPADYPFSPEYSPHKPVWQKRQQASAQLIESERQRSPVTVQDLDIRWTHTQALERVKNLQNARKTTHLSDVLYLATLHEVVTDESIEQRSYAVQEKLNTLKEAVEKRDAVIIQQTIITTVETITTWLETIEYRIYVNRQQTADGPSKERVQEFNNLKEEIVNIEDKVGQLQSVMRQANDIYNEDDRQRMKSYIDSLQQQVKVIEEVTSENEQLAAGDLKRWEEFVAGVTELTGSIEKLKKQLDDLKESDAAPQTKLNELDKIEHTNRCNMLKAVHLIATAKGLMRDFPTREIPKAVYSNHESTKLTEQQIVIEREKALQFLSLADEYEQTLKEFGQIIDVAEALVESPINVSSLEHLEDAMQNHRKFFVNLSHCRAILESLEENLDSETRLQHSELHRNLYDRAKVILDQATGRFQQMSLAASRWTILEQGMKEEMRWLQVAQQRVPDLSNVTSSDYDRFIDLYQSLALDIAHHQARIAHLNGVAQKLQELVVCSGLEEAYMESLEIILKLQDDVQNNLKRLMAFRDLWTSYNLLSDKIEYWLRDAEQQLQLLEVPGPRGHMRQFWELKAQHEVYNGTRQDATNNLEKALQVVPISDEMIQRKFHTEMQNRWNKISAKINNIQSNIIGTISATDVPINDKLLLLEQELEDLKSDVENLRGVIKTEEELNLYIERLQVMSTRLETIQNELGRLGLLSANESDKVGSLLALSKRLEIQIAEELEGATLLKERLQNIHKGISRVRRKHVSLNEILDQCEQSEKMGSEAVEKAVNDTYEVGEELLTLWQDLMGLRQLLHTLPMRLRITVSPVTVERDISQLQDDHTVLEKRCGQLLALLRGRLALWQRFEQQLELVQQSVQEADFMMELLTVQGTVDYDRLRKATERLEVSCL